MWCPVPMGALDVVESQRYMIQAGGDRPELGSKGTKEIPRNLASRPWIG